MQERSSGSHSDLHVVCTRSLTSSGYQSASDSTTGTVEYQVSSEHNKGVVVSSASVSLKHPQNNVYHSSGSAIAKTSSREPNRLDVSQNRTTKSLHGRSADSGQRPILCGSVRQCTRSPISSTTSSFRKRTAVGRPPSSNAETSMQAMQKHKRNQLVADSENNLTAPGKVQAVVVSTLNTECSDRPRPDCFLENGVANRESTFSQSGPAPKHPFVLEPVVYAVGTVRCTDL